MTAPRAVRAQKAMPVIGFLGSVSPGATTPYLARFHRGLSETGYVEGQNLAIEYRWAEGRYDRLPALAADLAARKVDVIVASATPGIAAAKGATSTIPIVFVGGGDLVAAGLIASLARPGGNLTGISIFGREPNPKRLDLLSELVPQAEVIALLVNPNSASAEPTIRDMQEAAHAKGVQLQADPFFTSRREHLVALAAHHAVPAIYDVREFAEAGGLISYGPSLTGTWHQVGVYTGRILKGAKPADLPVQQPTIFELVVNLKTAKALGLTVPPSILARADEVIE
jgi:putative ABC transport system substrate-binding protein